MATIVAKRTLKTTAKRLVKPQTSGLKRLVGIRQPNWVVSEVKYFMEARARSHRRAPDPGWFHPSGIGQPCDLRLALEFVGKPIVTPFTAQTLIIFDNGHYFHRRMTDYFKRMGILKAVEVLVEIPDERIRGSFDWVVEHPQTGEEFLLDGKGVNDWDFGQVKQKGASHHPKYVKQLHCYYEGWKCYQGGLYYENKHTQEHFFAEVPWDVKVWGSILERTRRIREIVEEGALPGNCGFCTTPLICENAARAAGKESV